MQIENKRILVALVCGLPIPGIAGSNLAEGMDARLL
jgi:hypothetical protein